MFKKAPLRKTQIPASIKKAKNHKSLKDEKNIKNIVDKQNKITLKAKAVLSSDDFFKPNIRPFTYIICPY